MLAKILRHRFGPVAVLIMLVSGISLLTRLFLFCYSFGDLRLTLFNAIGILLIGLFYDIIVGVFFALPLALYIWLMKDSLYKKGINKAVLFLYFFLVTAMLLLNVCAEVAFWDEFNVRYNFIAVDYLIYTTEVLGNIWESYNIPLILSAVALFSLAIVYFLRKLILASQYSIMRLGRRTIFFLVFIAFAFLAYLLPNNQIKNTGTNNFVNELGGNGIYEFGSAFWNNEIEYVKFYPLNNDASNFSLLRERLSANGVVFSNDQLAVERSISADSASRKWNLILISVESLSGDFLAHFGNQQQITPFLDSLIPHGLFFSNFYAVGTRTVRGLEALSLSIPPIPGQSVVRRPNNENMGTLGSVLGSQGYDVKYIYGGNSFFDNMGYYFSNNGYKVIDRRDIPDSVIHHETAWGVADEDEFNMALKECDSSYASGKLFFNHIMTVSNHRPYTYPDNRIDIPSSRQVREGAVKYSDYAINKFILDCKNKPWFAKTLFVIVSDHCAKSAGKVAIPVKNYHIPCLIYNPALVQPAVYDKLASQIDLVPTLLGLMKISYKSKFMGFDLFRKGEGEPRAFISNYQSLGFLRHDTLVVLSPNRKVSCYRVDSVTLENKPIPPSDQIVQEAISWYQSAAFLVKKQQKGR